MPEYIPRMQSTQGLAEGVLNERAKRVNPLETLVEQLGAVGQTYFKAKKERADKDEASKEKKEAVIVDADLKASIQALNDYTEGKAELIGAELPQDLKNAWRSFKPSEKYIESMGRRGGQANALNSPASEYMLRQIDQLNEDLAKINDPEAVGEKISRDKPPSLREAMDLKNTLEQAYVSRSGAATGIAKTVPKPDYVSKAQEEAGRLGGAASQVVKPPVKQQKAKDIEKEVETKLSTEKFGNSTYMDAMKKIDINNPVAVQNGVSAIKRFFPPGTADAEIVTYIKTKAGR